ncbi:MAG: hypothetical protein GXP32_01155 [Kiritimatiellaeota bacterium]|nr:hypothetical protein [Kiritimatiellota bacterium]
MRFAIVGTGNMVDSYVAAMKSVDDMAITGLVTGNRADAEKKIDEDKNFERI